MALAVALAISSATFVSRPAAARAGPNFDLPFVCGQQVKASTYVGHWQPYAVDFWRAFRHNGSLGMPIVAPAPATVKSFAVDHGIAGGPNIWLELDHGDGWTSMYNHVQAGSLRASGIRIGGAVAKGQVIGRIGWTGNVSPKAPSTAHLDFTIFQNGVNRQLTVDGSAITADWGGGDSNADFTYTSANCAPGTPAPAPTPPTTPTPAPAPTPTAGDGAIAATMSPDGRVELFRVDAAQRVLHAWQSVPGGSFSSWFQHAGSALDVAVAQVGGGPGWGWELYVVGGDGVVYRKAPLSGIDGWAALAGSGGSVRVAAAMSPDGRVELFRTDSSGQVWHAWQSVPGGSFSSWFNHGGAARDVGVSQVGGGPGWGWELFELGADGAVYRTAPLVGVDRGQMN